MKIKIYSTSHTPIKVSLHTQHILHTTLIVINHHKQKSSITVQSNNSNRIGHVMSLPRSVCHCFGHGPVPHSPTTHTASRRPTVAVGHGPAKPRSPCTRVLLAGVLRTCAAISKPHITSILASPAVPYLGFLVGCANSARLAQSVEYETLNPRVVGSSPTLDGIFLIIYWTSES